MMLYCTKTTVINEQEKSNKGGAGDNDGNKGNGNNDEEEEWLKNKNNKTGGWQVQHQERKLYDKKGGYNLFQMN